jgi:hypothetical protein
LAHSTAALRCSWAALEALTAGLKGYSWAKLESHCSSMDGWSIPNSQFANGKTNLFLHMVRSLYHGDTWDTSLFIPIYIYLCIMYIYIYYIYTLYMYIYTYMYAYIYIEIPFSGETLVSPLKNGHSAHPDFTRGSWR